MPHYAKVYSAQTSLLKAHIIDIEVDIIPKSLHAFTIVGLPDKAVEESKDRISAAIKNTRAHNFETPKKKNHKITIALAPANLKKEGPSFDLGIALAYLLASNQITFDPEHKLFLGELALDGSLRPIKGVLPLVRIAREQGFTEVFVPKDNAHQAALIDGITIYPADSLVEVIDHLEEGEETIPAQPPTTIDYTEELFSLDFSDVKGNESAKRGLIIAASGGHNIALYGPPGTGKSMLAKAFRSILPNLSFEDILEVTGIHSLTRHLINESLIIRPPFRSPHHTSSYVSMVGGGTIPKPGEVTLAHKGVLFLDEFPEFERRVLETLRQPLEDKIVSISRSRASAIFPANFILLAAMNPCPCGFFGSDRECICTPISLERYKKKLSGPIIDRIDMWIEVAKVEHEQLSEKRDPHSQEGSDARKKVLNAREKQNERYKNHDHIATNSDLGPRELLDLVPLSQEVKDILNTASKNMSLSARTYHKLIKLARTIADIEECEDIQVPHIMEALQYRPKSLS